MGSGRHYFDRRRSLALRTPPFCRVSLQESTTEAPLSLNSTALSTNVTEAASRLLHEASCELKFNFADPACGTPSRRLPERVGRVVRPPARTRATQSSGSMGVAGRSCARRQLRHSARRARERLGPPARSLERAACLRVTYRRTPRSLARPFIKHVLDPAALTHIRALGVSVSLPPFLPRPWLTGRRRYARAVAESS